MCMDLMENSSELVTGSSDHGLRLYDIDKGSFIRQLFNKQYGHSEWVTSCKFLKDKRVLSAGMDGVLCLWDNKRVQCEVLSGHKGSISKVLVDNNNIGISCGYDMSIMIWDLENKQFSSSMKGIHKSPIIDMEWQNSLVVSGDRNGVMAFWDINSQKCIFSQPVHKGPISKVKMFTDHHLNNLVVSIGNTDGVINFVDMRTHTQVYSKSIHKGSINDVIFTIHNQVITGSADSTVKIMDVNNGFNEKTIQTITTDNQIHCMTYFLNYLLLGQSNGNMLCYQLDSLECLYGYGVMSQGVVRQLAVNHNQDTVVAIGDDPYALVMYYY